MTRTVRSIATFLLNFSILLLLTTASHAQVHPDPGNLTQYKDQAPGSELMIQVTGSTSGSVWGSDNYTMDSKLAVAAVHAGALAAGETGVVTVTIVPGQAKYLGTARNGVTSSGWGSYDKSYQVRRDSVINDPGNLTQYTGQAIGTTLQFRVKGSTSGSVWGTNSYTADSRLAVAAVHAGALKSGEEGVITVTLVKGQPKYEGTLRNGVTSSNWGSYETGYTVASGDIHTDPGNLTSFSGMAVGTRMKIRLTGSTSGSVWGSDSYTLDSKLAAAAVHAGALAAGEEGVVEVTLSEGKPNYKGTSRNGVTSSNWGSYGKSYQVRKTGT